MAQVDSENSTAAPVEDAGNLYHRTDLGIPITPAPRAPSPQQQADVLLMRWRLARAAGIPAARRLDQEDRA